MPSAHGAPLRDLARGVQLAGDRERRAGLGEAVEDPAHERRLALDHHQPAVLDLVAQRRPAAHPHALLARGRELVPDALADHLALELGEDEQDVERQPAHRGRGVELLGDADEGHVVPLEHVDQLGEVGQRAAQAVDLVDHDHVDHPGLDVAQQPLQGGPLQRAARDAAVVVVVGQRDPALGLLAGDVGERRLALGVERVELQLQALLGGFPGIGRAAQLAGGALAHLPPPLPLQPKKAPAVPLRAGDRARDRAQALVPAPLPLEAVGEHRDLVLDAAPLADQLRADHRPVDDALPGGLRVERVGQRVELGAGRGLEAAVRQLLDPVGEPADQIAAAEPRRLLVYRASRHICRSSAVGVLGRAATCAAMLSVMLSVSVDLRVVHDRFAWARKSTETCSAVLPWGARRRARTRMMPAARISAISSRRSAGVIRSGWRRLANVSGNSLSNRACMFLTDAVPETSQRVPVCPTARGDEPARTWPTGSLSTHGTSLEQAIFPASEAAISCVLSIYGV